MSTTRDNAHRLIDVLSETQLRTAVAVLLGLAAEAEGRTIPWQDVEPALGERAAPKAGEGDLDALLEENPELRRQFEDTLEHLRRGEPLIPQELIERWLSEGEPDGR